MPGVPPIVGGSASDADEVMALRVRAACGHPAYLHCSAVRVAPRALVTAAHCVRDTPAGLLEVVRGPDALAVDAETTRVAATWLAPADIDLAVIATTTSLAGTTATMGDLPGDAVGATVTIRGFGSDGRDEGGPRREGTATIVAVDGASIDLGPGPALTCGGDSGGPVHLGGELVAITSFGDPLCATSTTAIRIDANRGFIDDAIVMAMALPENQPAPGEADCGTSTGGCSASVSPDLGLVLVSILALFAVACGRSSPPSGPCGGGKQHGHPPPKGTAIWCTDGSGVKEGPYTEWYASGPKKLETGYRKGRQHGAFASWHENGKPHEAGTLTDGLRTGRWREHYEDGTLKRESDHGAGGSEYRWTLYSEEGGATWIEGGFKRQREHGRFVEYYPDGKKLAEGDFADGQKSGTWSYWNPDGSPSTTELGSFAAKAFGGGPEGDGGDGGSSGVPEGNE